MNFCNFFADLFWDFLTAINYYPATMQLPDGFAYKPEYFDRDQQKMLMDMVTAAARGDGPFFQSTMPRTGQPMSVVGTNFGPLGWVSDKDGGYRYELTHPKTGKPWPQMPKILLDTWFELTDYPVPPEACLVNWYREGSKMGMHVDRDEYDVNAPVVSVSLGDQARFRIGGKTRGGKTMSLKLSSGDVVVLAGDARQCYHGVDKIFYGGSSLVPRGGRINLTMRRVNFPE